jgi:hypothetical protein
MDQHVATPATSHAPAVLLAKAATRAADQLDVRQRELAAILGISPAAMSRAAAGGSLPPGKATELAALFVRSFRSLDAIVGGDRVVAAAWMRNANTALGGIPIELMKTVPGLVDCLTYLDARRALV